MADNDIVLQALIQAGIELKPGVEKELRTRLAGIGEALGEKGQEAMRARAVDLQRLREGLAADIDLMNKIAKQPNIRLNSGEQAALAEAFSRVKTYQTQLKGLVGILNKIGLDSSVPVFDQLSSLEKRFNELGEAIRQTAPLVNGITQQRKAEAKALQRVEKLKRTNESLDARREALERTRELRGEATKRGKEQFKAGLGNQFLSITDKQDAREAQKYARAQAEFQRQFMELSVARHGIEDPNTQRAAREAIALSRAISGLDTRIADLDASDVLSKKDKAVARRLAAAEAKIARERDLNSRVNRTGRAAFEAAGGLDGSVASYASTQKAAKALAYLNTERRLAVAHQNALTEALEADDPRLLAAAKRTRLLADYTHDLGRQIETVSQLQTKQRTAEKKAESEQSKALAKRIAEGDRGIEAENKRRAREQTLQRNREITGLVNPEGRRAFKIGRVTGFAGVTDVATAKRAKDFAEAELATRRELAKIAAERFGSDSSRANAAARGVDRMAESYRLLKARIVELGDTNVSSKARQQLDQQLGSLRRKSANDRKAKSIDFGLFDSAAIDPSTLANLKDANRAIGAGSRELGRMQAIQNALAKSAASTGEEYEEVTREINRAVAALERLEARKRVLETAAAAPKARVEKAQKEAKPEIRRSAIYDEGRLALNRARSAGDIGALEGEERANARSYAQARRTELQGRYNQLSGSLGDQSGPALQAAAGIREYDEALRRLTGGGGAGGRGGPLGAAADGTHYLSNVFKMFLKYAIVYQSLYLVLSAVGALARGVADLQAEMLEIQAVTGSTADQMAKLGETVRSVAADSKFSLSELTQAAKVLAQAGIPVEALNTTLKATADFAAATGTNLETAADILSTTRDVFKELSDDVIANQLAKAVNISKLTGEDLKTILSLGAQTAKSFNITGEQFLGAVATLRNAGLKASTVATGLRQGMLEIFTPDRQLVQALQTRYRELGETMGAEAIKARFFEFTRADNPLVAALTELKRLGFADEGQLVLSRAFDIRSSNAIKAMIANLEELSANESRITFGRGAAEGAAVVVEGLNASLTRLYSTITGFTYERSQGLLGWLADVAQGATEALLAYDRFQDARDANQGRSREEKATSPFQETEQNAPGFLVSGIKAAAESALGPQARALFGGARALFDLRPGGEERDLEARIQGGGAVINTQQLNLEEFERAALAWDIRAASLGQAVGTGAEQIVNAAKVAERLRLMVENGLDPALAGQTEALEELLRGYANLTGSQRSDRRDELKKLLPRLAGLPDEQVDQTLFQMELLREQVAGSLTAVGEELASAVVKARQRIQEMDGRAPKTPQEFADAALLETFKLDEDIQNIVNANTSLSAEAQFDAIKKFSQALADQIRTSGGQLAPAVLARQQVSILADQAKLLAKQGDITSALPEIRAQAQALAAKYRENTDANISYLKTLADVLEQAKNSARGEVAFLLNQALLDLKGINKAKSEAVVQEAADRVVKGRQATKELANPDFQENVNLLPEADPDKAALQSYFNKQVPDAEFSGNTDLGKMILERVGAWLESGAEVKNIRKQVDERLRADLSSERRAGALEESAAEARNLNQFDRARGATTAATGERLAAIARKIADAESDIKLNTSRGDTDNNRHLVEEPVQLENERLTLLTKQAKTLSQLNQEELKLNNARATKAATGEQKRLETVLKNVGADTPDAVVEDTIRLYDANQEELQRLNTELSVLKGDQSAAAKEELAETNRKLVKYKEQNAYLDLLQRQEIEIRDRLARELDRPLTTGDSTEDARLDNLGLIPGSRNERAKYQARRAALVAEQYSSAARQRQRDMGELAKVDAYLANTDKNTPGYDQKVIDRRDLQRNVDQLDVDLQNYTVRIGEIRNELNGIGQSFSGALQQGFDLDTIILGLEQSESSVEKLAFKIHDHLIAGIEGVGDAFADALLEGEDFFSSLDKLFLDTGKAILRDTIKTYTTESITGFLKILSPKAQAEAGTPGAVPNPLGGGLGGLVKSGWDWLTGGSTANGNSPVPAVGGAAPDAGNPFDLGGALMGGKGSECCCGAGDPDGLLGLGDKPGDNTVLADAAKGESKGFFGTLLDGFSGIWDSLSGGFGKALEGIGGLLGMGGGGGAAGGGAIGLLASVFGFKNGGIIKAATGGIISGRGTGTSDSIPGFIRSRSGKLKPLLTSNGESILNARATSFLGEDGVHALNSGQFVQASTAQMSREIGAMMRGLKPGGAQAPAGGSVTKNYKTTQVAVTPAQMRMRMGDWLEQQVIEELSRR